MAAAWSSRWRPASSSGEWGSDIRSLVVLADGRLASSGKTARSSCGRRRARPAGGPRAWRRMAPVAGGAGGRAAGKRRRRRQDQAVAEGEAASRVVLAHGVRLSLAGLADGRLASGGEDGKIKLWPENGGASRRWCSAGRPESFRRAVLAGRAAGERRHGRQDQVVARREHGEPVVLRAWRPGLVAGGAGQTGGWRAGGEDGKIKLWVVDEQKLITALCLRAGRNLTKDEWARYIGPDTPWQPSCRDLPSNWRTPTRNSNFLCVGAAPRRRTPL